jgi:spermidine/putrescine transport system permease protein
LSAETPAVPDVAAAPAHRRRGVRRWPRGLLVLPPIVYVIAILIGPIVLIALYSVNLQSQYPGLVTTFSTTNWHQFISGGGGNPFMDTFKSSMVITLVVSVAVVIAAYPVAYYLAFVARRRRYTLLLALLAPFFTSYLLRIIAWRIILNDHGVVNDVASHLGLWANGQPPGWLLYSKFSVGLVLFYTWVPFVALPIFVVLENMNHNLIEAAHDLGADGITAFLRVTLPLSFPGLMAGFVFVLIPTTGEFIAPLLVGGPDSYMFGNAIQSLFSSTPDWNFGSVLALWLVGVVILLMLIFGRYLSADLRAAEATK